MIWALGIAALLAGLWTGFVFFANGMRSGSGKFVGAGTIWAAWLVVLILLVLLLVAPAKAHDHEHPELDQWYATRKQPDSGISCCGPSDAYWCNEGARGSQVVCTIDDDRDDKKLGRPHIPNGTVVEIPQHKINKDPNPTGRAVVWISPAGYVWCFVGISGS